MTPQITIELFFENNLWFATIDRATDHREFVIRKTLVDALAAASKLVAKRGQI
jgi:hypothetical protein